MPLYSTLASLSQTAASNAADGAVDAPSTIDQQTNLLASFIAQLRDGVGFTSGLNRIGQCRLAKSGANLLLSRYNGDSLFVNGVLCTIPSAGVSLAPTSLATNTTYYIYAVGTAGVVSSLEASTTAYAIETTYGTATKTGDASRALVGMARTGTGPDWLDQINKRFVASWFNQRPVQCQAALSANATSSATTPAELTANIRNEFLILGSQSCYFSTDGFVAQSNALATMSTTLALNTTIQEGLSLFQAPTAGAFGSMALSCNFVPSEGYNYVTVYGSVSGGTGTWYGNASTVGSRIGLRGQILQ